MSVELKKTLTLMFLPILLVSTIQLFLVSAPVAGLIQTLFYIMTVFPLIGLSILSNKNVILKEVKICASSCRDLFNRLSLINSLLLVLSLLLINLNQILLVRINLILAFLILCFMITIVYSQEVYNISNKRIPLSMLLLFLISSIIIVSSLTFMISYGMLARLQLQPLASYSIILLVFSILIYIYYHKRSIVGSSTEKYISVYLYDVAILFAAIPTVMIQYILSLPYKWGGIYWADIFRYASYLNDYKFASPFFQSPYILLFAFHGFFMDIMHINYITSFAVTSIVNIIQPLSFVMLCFTLFYATYTSECEHIAFKVAYLVCILLFYVNNILLPFFIQLLIQNVNHFQDIWHTFNVLYRYTIDKFGVPGLIPPTSWITPGGLGLAFANLGLSFLLMSLYNAKLIVINNSKQHVKQRINANAKFALKCLVLSMAYTMLALYASNLVIVASLLLLLLMFAIITTKSLASIYGFRTIIGLLLVLLFSFILIDSMAKFMLMNTIATNVFYLYNEIITRRSSITLSLFGILSLLAILIVLYRRCIILSIFTYIRRLRLRVILFSDNEYSILVRIFSIILFFVLLLSIVYIEYNINVLSYSSMWKEHKTLSLCLIVLRSYGPAIILFLCSIMVILRKKMLIWKEPITKFVILWFVSTIVAVSIIAIISPKDAYIVISRSLTYLSIPFALVTALCTVKDRSTWHKFLLLISVLLAISVAYTAFTLSSLYLGGKIYGGYIYNNTIEIFSYMDANKDQDHKIVVATISRETYYIITSLAPPTIETINLMQIIHSKIKNLTMPWYSKIITNSQDVYTLLYLMNSFNVKYVIINKYLDKNILSENILLNVVIRSSKVSENNVFILSKIKPLERYKCMVLKSQNETILNTYVIKTLLEKHVVTVWSGYLNVSTGADYMKTYLSHVFVSVLDISQCCATYIKPNMNVRGEVYVTSDKYVGNDFVLDNIRTLVFVPKVSRPKVYYGINIGINKSLLIKDGTDLLVALKVEDPNSYDIFFIDIVNEPYSHSPLSTFSIKPLPNSKWVVILLDISNKTRLALKKLKSELIWIRIYGRSAKDPHHLKFYTKLALLHLSINKEHIIPCSELSRIHKGVQLIKKLKGFTYPSFLAMVIQDYEKYSKLLTILISQDKLIRGEQYRIIYGVI